MVPNIRNGSAYTGCTHRTRYCQSKVKYYVFLSNSLINSKKGQFSAALYRLVSRLTNFTVKITKNRQNGTISAYWHTLSVHPGCADRVCQYLLVCTDDNIIQEFFAKSPRGWLFFFMRASFQNHNQEINFRP